MLVNSDFTRAVFLQSDSIPWESSPMAGVTRRRLDRLDTDDHQVTTLVEYAPNSEFSPHTHHGGEELLILDGVFEDEYGAWPAGSYIRNPPGSNHQPGSKAGCLLFVKLGQFHATDAHFVHAHLDHLEMLPLTNQPNRSVASLYQDARETVRLEHWSANTTLSLSAVGGMEIVVLAGSVSMTADVIDDSQLLGTTSAVAAKTSETSLYGRFDWIRLPSDFAISCVVGDSNTVVWTKSHHLPFRQQLADAYKPQP